jgi:L-fuconolactonase
MKLLQQDYLPEHLALTLKRNEVEGVVAVQVSQTELETHFLVELAKTHPVIKGVVGWIDLKDPKLNDRLQYFSQYPIIRGWRHIVQSEPDDFFDNPAFRRGVAALQSYNYTYDILIYHHQLKPAIAFASSLPEIKLVLDHCGKPDIKNKNLAGWKNEIHSLAALPNVYCKLSGLFTEARWKEWSPGDFYPYLDTVFDAFGTDRLMFGSDWPVMLLSGIYVQWKSLLEKYMENFKAEEKEKVFRTTAMKFYEITL